MLAGRWYMVHHRLRRTLVRSVITIGNTYEFFVAFPAEFTFQPHKCATQVKQITALLPG